MTVLATLSRAIRYTVGADDTMVAKTWEAELDDAKTKLKYGKIISAFGHLVGAAKDLSDKLDNRHRLGSDNGKVKVVHYTSLETIHALLTEPSQSLRLYDSVHLTDPQEGRYVFSDMRQASKWLEYPVSHAYIISLLPGEDDAIGKTYDHLSHWRAYGDNGRGCSLAVYVPRRELYKVNYCDSIKNDDANKLIRFIDIYEQVWNEILHRKKESHSEYEDMIRDSFATVLKSRFLHKHPSYEHERELRALVVAPDKCRIETEVRGRHIRHYVKNEAFSMKRLLTSDCIITVGPAVEHQSDVAESLKRILYCMSKSEAVPQVNVSEIPYRT